MAPLTIGTSGTAVFGLTFGYGHNVDREPIAPEAVSPENASGNPTLSQWGKPTLWHRNPHYRLGENPHYLYISGR
jgi:hypothetical protein